MLLGQGYVPVISPIALGDDGQSYNVSADEAASAIAVALKAQKLDLSDRCAGHHGARRAGHRPDGRGSRAQAAERPSGGMRVKLNAMIAALRGGVGRVHVIDGRTPHNLIAELFTDRGVGTLVTA